MSQEKFSIFDWLGLIVGVAVAVFILLILLWPLIDPTPDKSSSLESNFNHLMESESLKK